MSKKIYESFSFSNKQLSGLFVLCLLIITLIAKSIYLENSYKTRALDAQQMLTYSELAYGIDANENKNSASINRNEDLKRRRMLLTTFDPNKLQLKDWMNLGLSRKQSQTILNYIEKGGKFRKPEDLKKMFVISDELYRQLLPYVQIEHLASDAQKSKAVWLNEVEKVSSRELININLADSSTLIKIWGIGPTFAKRILAYRNRLGGYIDASQLLEIYGVDSAKMAQWKGQFFFGKNLTQILINSINFEELRRHPYLSYNQAQSIINYRQQHGDFETIEDLKKIKTLDDLVLYRLSPYLKFNHD